MNWLKLAVRAIEALERLADAAEERNHILSGHELEEANDGRT